MGNFFDSGVKEKFIEHLKSIDENSKPFKIVVIHEVDKLSKEA